MRILIRATNWVGDAIMGLPALQMVRARFPDAHIAILALPYLAQIYEGQGVADELISYDRQGDHSGIRGRERLAASLKAKQFDTALLLQNAFDAAWLVWRARIPSRIGYNRDRRGLLLTKAIPVAKPDEIPPHEKYYYLELLRRAGWLDSLPDVPEIKLRVPLEQSQRAEEKLRILGARDAATRIAIGAGASYGSAKCWPPDRFAKALNAFLRQHDADVIFYGTLSETPVTEAITAELSKPPMRNRARTISPNSSGWLRKRRW